MSDLRSGDVDAIAVVGLACRVPAANDPGAFWRLLRDGVDAVVARLTELARRYGPRFTPDAGWSLVRSRD